PQHPHPRPDRSLPVALMRPGATEHPHDPVPNDLPHRPAVTLDLPPHPLVVRSQPRPHVLGIGLLRCRREPDQVAEKDRDDLALLADGGWPLLTQQRRAVAAELEP